MPTDLHVMNTTGRASLRQLRSNLPIMRSGLIRKGQHLEPGNEIVDGMDIVGATRGFLGTVIKLAKRDAGYAKLLRESIEFLS